MVDLDEFVVNILFLAAIAFPRRIARAGLFGLFAVSLAEILQNGLIGDGRRSASETIYFGRSSASSAE